MKTITLTNHQIMRSWKFFSCCMILISLLTTACQEEKSENYRVEDKKVVVPYKNGEFEFYAVADKIINVRYADSITYSNRNIAPILEASNTFDIVEKKNYLELKNGNTSVQISYDPFQIAFKSGSKTKLITSKPFSRNGDTTKIGFKLSDNEAIYGTGARALPMNRRGYKLQNYNKASYAYQMGAELLNYCIPHITSSNQYMLLVDNPAKSFFDIGKSQSDELEFSSLGGNMSYYFIDGENYNELITTYTTLTGRQEIPPIWSFGNLQSRFGYRDQKEAIDMLDQSIKAGYPVDAMILDIYWFGPELQDGQMGKLTWDGNKWPDPKSMIKNFKSKGVNTVTVSEPFFTLKSGRFEALQSKGYLGKDTTGNAMQMPYFYFGNAGLLDIFNDDAKEWMWNEYLRQGEYGIDGWWVDLGEPEVHPDSMIHINGLGREVHGAYGHEWAKMLYEGYEKDFPNERMFHMGRAGFAGSQRYSLIPWSGDVSRTWSGLRAQLPVMLGIGMSGISYMHADAGGFSFVEKAHPELYTRWLQFAAFTPIFRPHADEVVPPEPVTWSNEVQANVRPSIDLRYQLLPYNYTLAWNTMKTGLPMARPMFMEDLSIPDTLITQYMWGDQLLVSPVLEPEITELSTYLPNGKWYNLYSNQEYDGSQWVNTTLEADKIPVFVKEGSVITMTEKMQNTSTYNGEVIALNYYSSNQPSEQEVYFDDGKTKEAFTNDQYQIMSIESNPNGESLEMNINVLGKGYEGAPEVRVVTFNLIGINPPSEVKVDGNNISFTTTDQVTTFKIGIKKEAQLVIN